MKHLLIDTSSLIWTNVYRGKDEESGVQVEVDGKKKWINGWQYAYDHSVSFVMHAMEVFNLKPEHLIFVKEGKLSKSRRTLVYPTYKGTRSERHPLEMEAFTKARDGVIAEFQRVGAQAVTQDGVEADDIIGFLSQKLNGQVVIMSNDGDLTVMLSDRTCQLRNGGVVTENPYGPFSPKFIPVYKALVGDSSDNIKGAKGFGEKAFQAMFVNYGERGLAAVEGMIKRNCLDQLADDVSEYPPFQKIIDAADDVVRCYYVACLHPEWVDTEINPLIVLPTPDGAPEDFRLSKFVGREVEAADLDAILHPEIVKQKAVIDTEIIGKERPVFLACIEFIETGERHAFWWHREGDMKRLGEMLSRKDVTFISFNGIGFDQPLLSAAVHGHNPSVLKQIAQRLIDERGFSWNASDIYGYDTIKFDHIDLIEPAPGVRISLKTYAGRMGYPTMVDMPFHHDQDLSEDQLPVVEDYCFNDLGVTKELYARLKTEIDLREELSLEHGIDLRSKSDAQVAEAILRKAASIKRDDASNPTSVRYTVPGLIETDSDVINEIVQKLNAHEFKINQANGVIETPAFLEDPVELGYGTYQMGIGGLHSTHDKNLYVEETEETLISDFDVASYYPNIMLAVGLIPHLNGKGEAFIKAYRDIYDRRIEAKRAGNKRIANALKISLNGTFGKLGSPYASFYSPDLMLAVTLTGQLNLMCLIYDLEFDHRVKVISANTDGIMVQYPAGLRDRVLKTVWRNTLRTGFEYEETRYAKVGMKDVNNYVAITRDGASMITAKDGVVETTGGGGKAKRKGLYASNNPEENPLYLMKNPSCEVAANLAVDYLKTGIHPRDGIHAYTDVKDYVAIRNVKGGGVQHLKTIEVDDWVMVKDCVVVDDWVETEPGQWFSAAGNKTKASKKRPKEYELGDRLWFRQAWFDAGISQADKAPVKRKSRPDPAVVGIGGTPFGRIARWYMTTESLPPISYVGSGSKVPKTEGAKLCMTLPDSLPADIDFDWYINEALAILGDLGVPIEGAAKREENEDEAVEA